MTRFHVRKFRNMLLNAFKIGVGSSVAIYIANMLELEYAITAGSIALLTIATTKWGTLKLSVVRILTFFAAAWICSVVFTHVPSQWVAYGIFIFFIVLMCDLIGWRSAMSVNALIGMHFLSHMDEFSQAFIMNEFMLLIIGVSISIVLNLFHAYKFEEQHLIKNMRHVEESLVETLLEIAEYLENHMAGKEVWKDVDELEQITERFIQEARDYQDNTFYSHPGYYIDYFVMRRDQCKIMQHLHKEMKAIKNLPKQAQKVSEYIRYLSKYVTEKNEPVEQIVKLELLIEEMKREELPVTREEFENRALLYHTLMDLEDFLNCKKEFVENLDETRRKLYWMKE